MMAIFSLATTPPPLASLLTALVVEIPLMPAHTLTPSHSRSLPPVTAEASRGVVYADSLVDRRRTATAEVNPRLTARRDNKAAPDIPSCIIIIQTLDQQIYYIKGKVQSNCNIIDTGF